VQNPFTAEARRTQRSHGDFGLGLPYDASKAGGSLTRPYDLNGSMIV